LKIIYLFKSIIASIKLTIHTGNPFIFFRCSVICKGKLIIRGSLSGFRNAHLQIEPNGVLILNKNLHVSENINIRCCRLIDINKNCRFAPNTIISDTTYRNLGSENPEIIEGKIKIGSNCFVGAFTIICGNVIVKDGAIIGSHMIIKNKEIKEGSLYTLSTYKNDN
tara:strand:+ start:12 stop:509 length:498 start_codon:yes stop_codon:yes gene_type:complete